MKRAIRTILILLMLAPRAALPAQAIDPNHVPASLDPKRTANGLTPTPPMGWNSWNKFACKVDEATIRATADAIAANGMKDAGYRYVLIDDCWHGARDADGVIAEDHARFSSGIKALADYVHAKGLKFGIYSDAGKLTCGGRPGSQGHEYQDALRYARWGVDYLKYDWCSTGTRNAEEAYALMADALRATGRDIVFSICEWGQNKPWLWAAKIGNLWRTTGDIRDSFDQADPAHDWAHAVVDIVDQNEPLWPFAGPGHWNDPDMLEVGNGGMSEAEYRSHFSLWAMMAAPLIAGNDVAHMDAATRGILLNREVIAVDQDMLGAQGRRVWRDGDHEAWVKPLSGGRRAVLLFNRGAGAAAIGVTWATLDYPARLHPKVRDLWAHRDVRAGGDGVSATVQPHDVAMLLIAS